MFVWIFENSLFKERLLGNCFMGKWTWGKRVHGQQAVRNTSSENIYSYIVWWYIAYENAMQFNCLLIESQDMLYGF